MLLGKTQHIFNGVYQLLQVVSSRLDTLDFAHCTHLFYLVQLETQYLLRIPEPLLQPQPNFVQVF